MALISPWIHRQSPYGAQMARLVPVSPRTLPFRSAGAGRWALPGRLGRQPVSCLPPLDRRRPRASGPARRSPATRSLPPEYGVDSCNSVSIRAAAGNGRRGTWMLRRGLAFAVRRLRRTTCTPAVPFSFSTPTESVHRPTLPCRVLTGAGATNQLRQ